MKKLALIGVLSMSLGAASARAGDIVDWCQFGCTNASFASPQTWTSVGGVSGTVGLVGGGQSFYNPQQDTSWWGNFDDDMGLIYNGAANGSTPADIEVTFDKGVYGVGAYIEADYFGSYTATITLLGVGMVPLHSYSASGTTPLYGIPGTAPFISASSSTPVWGALFDAQGTGPHEPDFAIGQMDVTTTPEPCSMLLMGSFLGVLGFIRRKLI